MADVCTSVSPGLFAEVFGGRTLLEDNSSPDSGNRPGNTGETGELGELGENAVTYRVNLDCFLRSSVAVSVRHEARTWLIVIQSSVDRSIAITVERLAAIARRALTSH